MSTSKIPLMITDPNQAYMAKMTGRRVQEESTDSKENLPPQPDFEEYTYKPGVAH